MDRAQKEAAVAGLNQTFGEVNLVIVTHQSGLTVYESMTLRRKVRDAGAGFKVTKNRLTRLALEGTKFQALQSLMTGPTYRRPSATGAAVEVYPLALPRGEGASVPLGQWGEIGFANRGGLLALTVPWGMSGWLRGKLGDAIVRGPEAGLSLDGDFAESVSFGSVAEGHVGIHHVAADGQLERVAGSMIGSFRRGVEDVKDAFTGGTSALKHLIQAMQQEMAQK